MDGQETPSRALRRILRWAGAAFVLAAVLGSMAPARAQGGPALRELADLAVVGFGSTFVENLRNSQSCRNAREARLGASSDAAINLLGAVAGGLIGVIIGSEHGRDGMALGRTLGSLVGPTVARTLIGAASASHGNDVAGRVEAASRDLGAEFAFEACRIILAADVVRGPHVARYVELGLAVCPDESAGGVTPDELRRFVLCANQASDAARLTLLHIIRINQGACSAIAEVGRRLVAERAAALEAQRNRGVTDESLMPFALPMNPDCDLNAPAAVWATFVRGRL